MNGRLPVLARTARYAVVGALALAIAAASLAPVAGGSEFALLGVGADKWVHVAGYACLAGALAYARLADRRELLGVVLVVVGFGFAVELGQAPLAERTFSVADLLANAVGAGFGATAWAALPALAFR